MPRDVPQSPTRNLPESDWNHAQLYHNIREAIVSLPSNFHSTTNISGILATDLHTLNTVLGATIEEKVVSTLNEIRAIWDPLQKYAFYRFVRQAQTFPDVLFHKAGDDRDIVLGIELKGWYLLAKERSTELAFSHNCGRLRNTRSYSRRSLGTQ